MKDDEHPYDVKIWAEANSESYDAICELTKVPARLGLHDDDLVQVSACLQYFENVVAPSGYGAVSKSKDLKHCTSARQLADPQSAQALSLRRADTGNRTTGGVGRDYRPCRSSEGFVDRGARFTRGASKALWILRARLGCAPGALDQARSTG